MGKIMKIGVDINGIKLREQYKRLIKRNII